MKLDLYQKNAARTLAKLDTHVDDMIHMDLGLVTELGECLDIIKKKHVYKKDIDPVHMGEELADVSWYVAGKCTLLNIVITDEQLEAATQAYFSDEVTEFESLVKDEKEKIAFMRSLFSYMLRVVISSEKESIFKSPVVMLAGLKFVAKLLGIDYYAYLEKNINKLKVRYPEKFSEENALVRDLDKEREALEN